ANCQHVEEVPGFDGIELDRCGCRQQEALGARGEVVEEGEQVIRSGLLPLALGAEVLTPQPMRLVDDTVRCARRPMSSMTNSASGTANGLCHRASNSS